MFFIDESTGDSDEKTRGGGKIFLKIFSDYNYSRNWESSFVLDFNQ